MTAVLPTGPVIGDDVGALAAALEQAEADVDLAAAQTRHACEAVLTAESQAEIASRHEQQARCLLLARRNEMASVLGLAQDDTHPHEVRTRQERRRGLDD